MKNNLEIKELACRILLSYIELELEPNKCGLK
jgi:hypothetical protein